uniref:hypothetical protein n=1 Tax=Candidatus Cryptobacteroides bacterium TaxID=3085639 RepID=UPI0040293F5B
MVLNNSQKAFFALLQAGLWEDDSVSDFKTQVSSGVDWSEVQRLTEEQSVVGLVASGIDVYKANVPDLKIAKADALQFIGQTIQLEQRNQAMNYFIGVLTDKIKEADIGAVLMKGHGVAQCYERPLWRVAGVWGCGSADGCGELRKSKGFLNPFGCLGGRGRAPQ